MAGIDTEWSTVGRVGLIVLNGLVSSLRDGILSHDGTPTLHELVLALFVSCVGDAVSSLPYIDVDVDGGYVWCACDATGVKSAEVGCEGLGERDRVGEGVLVTGTNDEPLRREMCVYSSGSGSTIWKGRDKGNSCSGRRRDVNLKPEELF